jgi:hypothetical protein
MAQAVAQARPREQRPQTLRGAVEAIGQDAPDPMGRLVLPHHSLELLIRLGKCSDLITSGILLDYIVNFS